ncbi:MAG: alpha-glucan family phosphorylase [Chloroflexi bacterium]|nr:alpha-glucan family phosphorylase [Chloroflexota bacterium]
MEFGINATIPTYSGGLGILAGDTMRTAADLGLPAVGVTLLHHRGYFRQKLDANGNQYEASAEWSPEACLELLPLRVVIHVANRQIHVGAWRYHIAGQFGQTVPVIFLDTDIPENMSEDRHITDYLYGGNSQYRLYQEAVLGLGGLALLRAMGYHRIQAYHMNEGHSALLVLGLLEEQVWGRRLVEATHADREVVRQRCIFTTHTPVLAGHDNFPIGMVREILGEERSGFLATTRSFANGQFSMTDLALEFARYVNGVSMRHEETAHAIFPNQRIDSITNGVHALTWTSSPFCRLYDRYIPEWRRDNLYLRYAIKIPLAEVWQAHLEAKKSLLAEVKNRVGVDLDPEAMTIGFARRATLYKRTDLIFSDIERLKRIARQNGPIQIICGGKAHPADKDGQELIRRIFNAASALKGLVKMVYLEEYDMLLATYVCSGVDLWLNTPHKPYEASGTSGMKAALNGIPCFSVLDGWWVEGHLENVTGWSIGGGWQAEANSEQDALSLYDKLENTITPLFYQHQEEFVGVMRSAIAINGSYFNTQRMLTQYLQNAYMHNSNNNTLPE